MECTQDTVAEMYRNKQQKAYSILAKELINFKEYVKAIELFLSFSLDIWMRSCTEYF